jgi:starch synthase
MVATESNPYVKVGGLGDVVFGLAKSYVERGHDAFIFLPFYERIKHQNLSLTLETTLHVHVGWRYSEVKVWKSFHKGVIFYFIDHPSYFHRQGIYGYGDDDERWAFYVHSVRQFIHYASIKPSIVHVHDYHPGMLATLMKQKDRHLEWMKSLRFVYTIHSPAFQGELDRSKLDDYYQLHTDLFDHGYLRLKDKVSTLKAALMDSDAITTVSPTHAEELKTSEGGFGLDGVLKDQQHKFKGILNGIDHHEWNPYEDALLPSPFDKKTPFLSKRDTKNKLYQKLGLLNADRPLYGMVARLTYQKGIGLLLDNIEHFIHQGADFVILGAGEQDLEHRLSSLAQRYPHYFKVHLGYDNALAHAIYASSDFFLMPSLFEPCGISQMIAMRYGTLPIVRETGGLIDTVIGHHQGIQTATGFTFAHYTGDSLGWAMQEAKHVFYRPDAFEKMRKNAMQKDFGWATSADEYLRLYHQLDKS